MLTTDDVVAQTGVDWRELRSVCAMLEELGIVTNDVNITAYVHIGPPRPSEKRLEEAIETEKALVDVLREEAPDDVALQEHATELKLRRCAERVRERTERATLHAPTAGVVSCAKPSEVWRNEEGHLERVARASLNEWLHEWGPRPQTRPARTAAHECARGPRGLSSTTSSSWTGIGTDTTPRKNPRSPDASTTSP